MTRFRRFMSIGLSPTLTWVLTAALTVTLTGALTCTPALCAAVLFVPDGGNGTGSINAAIPLPKLNGISLPRGRVLIKGDSITVSIIPEWQFDRVAVLTGTVLDTRLAPGAGNGNGSGDGNSNGSDAGNSNGNGSGNSNGNGSSRVEGVAIFTDGDWLRFLSPGGAGETVETSSQSLNGKITSVAGGVITLALPSGTSIAVPLADVTDLHSPRVFRFAIPVSSLATQNTSSPFYAQSNSVSLRSTERPSQLKALKTEIARQSIDGDVSTRKLVFIGTTLSLLNLAQIAPLLAIPLANAPALRAQAAKREFPFLLQNLPVQITGR